MTVMIYFSFAHFHLILSRDCKVEKQMITKSFSLYYLCSKQALQVDYFLILVTWNFLRWLGCVLYQREGNENLEEDVLRAISLFVPPMTSIEKHLIYLNFCWGEKTWKSFWFLVFGFLQGFKKSPIWASISHNVGAKN